MKPAVSVIMISYQTRDRTVACLRALSRGSPVDGPATPYEVILVDNASADGSADAVRKACPWVQVIDMPANIGFGRAVNAAAAAARSPYLLLMNPDTVPVGDIVGDLARFAREHPGRGIYAGRTRNPDGTDELGSSYGRPTLWGFLCFASGLSTLFPRSGWANPEKLLERDRVRDITAFSGCVVLIERDMFHQLGGFEPRYFMYSEDVDLSLRAGTAGYRPLYNPSASVLHVNGASSTSTTKRLMVLRGKCTMVRLRWTPWRATAALALLTCGVAVRALGTAAWRRGAAADQTWLAVWRQRDTWLAGWPEPFADFVPVPTTRR